jgi:hypothetical protein
MYDFPTASDAQPVMWLRGRAVYASHLLVLIFAGSMLVTTLMLFLRVGGFFAWLPFDSGAVLRGEVWRVFTYGLVNRPSLWFVVDMFMIAWFGRELERFFGRGKFLRMYLGLYFVTPLLFTAIGRWYPATFEGESGSFAIFVGFATLYPNAVLLFNLLAKWLAAILVGIYTLMALAARDVVGLISLGSTVGLAFAYVRYEQGHFTLPDLRFWRRKPRLRVLPDLKPAVRSGGAGRPDPSMHEVDALLDKIAQSGIASLTAKERARLDAARTDLLRKKETGR